MRWARTGCLVESSARLIKLASRSFSFRNLVFRILTRRICDDDGPTQLRSEKKHKRDQPQKGHKKHKTDTDGTFCAFCAFLASTCVLALNDLYVRTELDVEIALTDFLVLFQSCQTHRRRVVILLNDLGLDRHAAGVNPDFSVLVTSISLWNERQVNRADTAPQSFFTYVLHRLKACFELLARHVHHVEQTGRFAVFAAHSACVACISNIQSRAKDRVFVVVDGQHFASRMAP